MFTFNFKVFRGVLLGVLLSMQAVAGQYTLSANGQEVTDSDTGLIWRRCIEGYFWNGTTCINSGTLTTFNLVQAQQHAVTVATAAGLPWRVPNVKELESLLAYNASNPNIDSVVFPGTPSSTFLSSSPSSVPNLAMAVNFNADGGIIFPNRLNPANIRLVRSVP